MAAVLYAIFAFGVAVALFGAMLVLSELTRRPGLRARATGAATWFEGRRQLVVDDFDVAMLELRRSMQ
jgi:hypothetical protein